MKILLMLLSLCVFAFGHTTFLQNSGFGSGFLHPIGGLDHVLAMVGVGMLAFFTAKKGYLLLVAFISAMFLAAIFGLFHGFAHGAEFQSGSFVGYMLGFTLSTLFLHLSGIALAYAYTKSAKAECVIER